MRYPIVFGGEDVAYIEQLGKYLLETSKYDFDITYLDTTKAIEEQLNTSNYPVFILEENFWQSLEDQPIKGTVVLLTEGLSGIIEERTLFKYQPASQIAEQIQTIFLEMSMEKVDEKIGKTQVIACFSLTGGVENSRIASTLAKIKSSQGEKVLHINLDLFPMTRQIYTSMQVHDFSDYLVHVLSKSNWILGLEKMVAIDERTGVHFFWPRSNMKDLIDLDTKILLELIEYIATMGDYTTLLLELDTSQMANTLKLLEICNQIVYTLSGNRWASMKWHAYKKELNQLDQDRLLEKAVVVASTLSGIEEEAVDVRIAFEQFSGEGNPINFEGEQFYKEVEGLADVIRSRTV